MNRLNLGQCLQILLKPASSLFLIRRGRWSFAEGHRARYATHVAVDQSHVRTRKPEFTLNILDLAVTFPYDV